MKKQKVCAYVVADSNNMKFYENLKKTWEKTNPDIELRLFGEKEIKEQNDPHFFYRATPVLGRELLKEYDTVIKIDADSLVFSDLSHTWDGDFDLAVVQNSNPREAQKLEVKLWNLHPLQYVNAGYVVMKSKKFVEHWYKQCFSPNFTAYRYREQDLLNILIFYGNYKVKFLDIADKFHGLASKGYEPEMVLEKGKIILKSTDEWATDGDKEICITHFAGGNDPNKGKYKTMYSSKVAKHIDKLLA